MAASGKNISVKIVGDSSEFSISLSKAQLKLLELKGSADSLTRTLGVQTAEARKAAAAISAVGNAGHSSVSGLQASSASLRLLQGGMQNNLRAAERFITTIPGLSSALKVAFPVVGGIALLGVFSELFEHVEKLKKAFDDLKDAPNRIAGAFNQLTMASIKSGDTIDVTNAKLQESINKLQGKPNNGIALAIAEAKQRADELSSSLTGDIAKIEEILTKESFSKWSWKSVLGNQAPTSEFADQFKGFQKQSTAIDLAGSTKELAANTAGDKTGAATAATEAAEAKLTATRKELTIVTGELTKAQENQANREAYIASQKAVQNAPDGKALQAALAKRSALQGKGYDDIPQQDDIIATAQGTANSLTSKLNNAAGSDRQVKSEATLHALQLAKEQADAYREVTKTLEELRAKIKGVSEEAAAGTPVTMAHAKAFAEAEQVISRLKESLAEHGRTLKASDAAQIRSMEVTLADLELQKQTDAEFKKTVQGINEKVDGYKRLTAAINQGYAAQRAQYVQDTLEKESAGKNYSPAQKATIGSAAGQEFDAGSNSKTDESVDKVQKHTAVINAEAAAALKGAAAVREFALAQNILNETRGKSAAESAKITAALTAEAAAQEKLKTDQTIEKLQQETAAQQRLNVARLQGNDAVRAAQLANSIANIKQTTAPGAEQDQLIAATKLQSQVAEQTRLLGLATQIDYSNKQKLSDLDKQLALMHQIGASALAIKETEAQRTELLDKIALQSGSMADVMRATFDQMGRDADHVREQIQSTMISMQEGVNDNLTKLIMHQKTDWAGMFKQQASGMLKNGMKDVEGKALGHFGLGGGKKDGSSESAALYVRLSGGGAGGIKSVPVGQGIKGVTAGAGSPLGADGLPTNPGTISPSLGDLGPSMGGGFFSSAMKGIKSLFGGGGGFGSDSGGGSSSGSTFGSSAGTPDGSQSNPFYVTSAGGGSGGGLGGLMGGGSSGGSGGSGLSSLMGRGGDGGDGGGGFMGMLSSSFAGGFASGGDIPGGSTALVGEAGPELIRTGSSGSNVTPNKDLGGSSLTQNIDARGADPVLMNARIKAASKASYQASVKTSQQNHTNSINRRSR